MCSVGYINVFEYLFGNNFTLQRNIWDTAENCKSLYLH